ncbi:MAG: class I SAM-dependent methyltransferase [Candidatus Thorarchaeota archaeon]
MNYIETINSQYGQTDLAQKILTILQRERINNANLLQEVLIPIEELHLRGRAATLELAKDVGLNKNMRVLDIGSGFGGPTRTLASEFGCKIIGIDLCVEYCRAAELINERMGLNNRIEILEGNALNIPFEDSSFDIVFLEHVLMNIENKKRLISQVYRILRPEGRLAFYTVCAGSIQPIHLPVIWANDYTINFLVSPSELHELISKNGFTEVIWEDETEKVLEGLQIARSKPRSNKPRLISFELLVPNPSEKWANIVRNLKEGRVRIIKGIFQRI